MLHKPQNLAQTGGGIYDFGGGGGGGGKSWTLHKIDRHPFAPLVCMLHGIERSRWTAVFTASNLHSNAADGLLHIQSAH
jgi:hypothetical protein